MKVFGLFGPLELGIILVVILIIFGPKNLPKLGKAIGKSMKNLRSGMDAAKEESEAAKKETAEAEAVGDEVIETEEVVEETAEAPKKRVVKKVVKKSDE